jgi:uncharacterized phage infection (PIP) family protein YhgE
MERSRRFHIGVGSKLSNSRRGRINPKFMAITIINAVTPLVTMLVSRAGAPDPIETNSTRPVAALNRKKAWHQ